MRVYTALAFGYLSLSQVNLAQPLTMGAASTGKF